MAALNGTEFMEAVGERRRGARRRYGGFAGDGLLLAASEKPDREFDAVVFAFYGRMSISEFQDPVVGEDERAFLGDQFRHVLERLAAVVLEPDPVTASWVR